MENILSKITKASGDTQAVQQTLADSVPFLLTEVKPEVRQQLSIQMEGMMQFCEFNQRKCDIKYNKIKPKSF